MPIIVAVNKIDRENADVDKAIAGVAEHNLVPEEWGGDTIFQRVRRCRTSVSMNCSIRSCLSPRSRIFVRLPWAEPKVVLESNLDIGQGPVATVLVQSGTLRVLQAIRWLPVAWAVSVPDRRSR